MCVRRIITITMLIVVMAVMVMVMAEDQDESSWIMANMARITKESPEISAMELLGAFVKGVANFPPVSDPCTLAMTRHKKDISRQMRSAYELIREDFKNVLTLEEINDVACDAVDELMECYDVVKGDCDKTDLAKMKSYLSEFMMTFANGLIQNKTKSNFRIKCNLGY